MAQNKTLYSLLTSLVGLAAVFSTACFEISGQGDSVSFDFQGEVPGAPRAECAEDSGCPVGAICVRGFCSVGCRSDTDCPSGTVCGGTPASCVTTLECQRDADCGQDRPVCHPTLSRCVACLQTGDCTGEDVCLIEPECAQGQRLCTAEDYQCSLCTSDAQCLPGACDLESGRCVECGTDEDCGSGLVCDTSLGQCTQCASNDDCSEPRPACLRTPEGGECVLCAVDADCGEGTCNQDTLSCQGCQADSDCRGEGLRCNTGSGLCYDEGCVTVDLPTLLELRVEQSISVPHMAAPVVVAPLVGGTPDANSLAHLLVSAAPPSEESPALLVFDPDGDRVWSTVAQIGAVRGLASGDMEGDGLVDLVALRGGRLVGLNASGSPQWTSGTRTSHLPGLFDVDEDGFAEIVSGGSLFSETGARVWLGGAHQGGHINLGLPGAGFAAPLIDDSPGQEVVAGGTIYSAEGEVLCSEGNDGYSALSDLNRDGSPEIVVVSSDGSIRAMSTACELVWGPLSPDREGQGGGPPSIADLDGDESPDLVYVARGSLLVAVSGEGSKLWEVPLVNAHPVSGVGVVDLDADGIAEVLVSDSEGLKIFRGQDGFLRTTHPEGASVFPLASPIPVDLDNDGSTEIVVSAGAGDAMDRVVIFGDVRDRWVDTRNVWNQVTYVPAGVRDDLTIPVNPGAWWEDDPSWRSQPITAQAEDALDLVFRRIPGAIDATSCPDRFVIAVGIYNRGVLPAPAGVLVSVEDPAIRGELLRLETTRRLDPGEEEILLITLDDFTGERSLLLSVLRDPERELEAPECNKDNNTLLIENLGCILNP